MNGKGGNRLCDWSTGGALVVGELKLIKVLSQKILAVDTGEIEVIEGRREIGGGRAHEAFKIIDGVIVRRQEKEFGALMPEVDAAGGEV